MDTTSTPSRSPSSYTPRTNGRVNGESVADSPWRHATDPVSRQLLLELGRLGISDALNFRQGVDRIDEKRNQAHEHALQEAAARHDQVRRTAEAVRQEHELRLQIEREGREREELWKLEQARRARADQTLAAEKERLRSAQESEAAERAAAATRRERAAVLDKARADREQREAEEARQRKEQAEAQQKAQQEAQQRAQQVAEEEAKAKARAVAALKAGPPQQPRPAAAPEPPRPTPQPTTTQAPADSAIKPERIEEHQRYLQLHQRLKQLRKFVMAEGKKNPNLKKVAGDSRRCIRKCCGQLTEDTAQNRSRITEVITILKDSLKFTHPQIAIADYFAVPPSDIAPGTQAPVLLVYLLNILAKTLIAQFINETSAAPRTANALGILGSTVYAKPEFQWDGRHPFIDLFLAKYHVVCPVLFGLRGDEASAEGKRRLGWWRDPAGQPVSSQRHAERMAGLGLGFAAMALRNFERSKMHPPLPPHHWWRAVADITNVPAGQATSTHCLVLKALVENSEARILEFFGDVGLAVLRRCLLEFPGRPEVKGTPAANSLALLKDVLEKDKMLYL